ncbi:MAG: DNA mismatch repair endonuclease MutL [Proteobacteria bacterium]|nr:DNA mismatch repair endonuclease MutL [Pseudomonadota bacterium]
MARVHLLDDELINKIAAGEVVERPANVVKELVENSIDAGASHIKVTLKDGGRQLIQVLDDGFGMDPADAALAVKRHTTSKLMSADDLFQVSTMGFRGEALASIASVSRFTLQTQARGSQEGVRIQISEGESTATPWQGAYGTSLSIADLFYNIPARKAFLKTASAEFAACHEYMQSLALSLPQIGFTLVHNDKEIFSLSPQAIAASWPRGENPLRQRAAAVLGDADAERLIYLHKIDRHAKIEALVSAPGHDKGTARHCFSFVNGRWVRDKLLRFAIQRAYHSHLLKGKFPLALLYLEIDPALLDVNVHPAKTELRFQYAQEVQNAIVYAVREVLRDGAWAAGTPSWSKTPPVKTTEPEAESRSQFEPTRQPVPDDFDLLLQQNTVEPQESSQSLSTPSVRAGVSTVSHEPLFEKMRTMPASLPVELARPSGGQAKPPSQAHRTGTTAVRPPDDRVKRTIMSFDPLTAPIMQQERPLEAKFSGASPRMESTTASLPSKDAQEAAIPWAELHYIGPFARCFLLFEYREQMLAIDQHAFHERILYERLQKDVSLLSQTQPLLIPEVLAFSPTECETLLQLQDRLAGLGIHLHGVSADEVEVTAVPSILMNKDLTGLLAGILAGYDRVGEFTHDTLATMACHAAVRAGEDLPAAELQALLREAESVDFYHNCPHGRRVFRWWNLAKVSAWFDR